MPATTLHYKASCKLMLFGEYLVLQGAKSLAFPLKFGQTLEIERSDEITWESSSPDGIWFEATFNKDLTIASTNNVEVAEILAEILKSISVEKPELNVMNDYRAKADFNLSWGLGSSSTLISLLGQWSGIDPFKLLKHSFGGSGYDIACATANKPIVFEKNSDHNSWREVELTESVTNYFLFVYLGQKQNSRNEIKRFKSAEVKLEDITQMNEIIESALNTDSIKVFEKLLNDSEELLSPIIGKQKLKEHIFADYKYSIKSLGAWGGDFFLATYRNLDDAKEYFKNKGLDTMFTYKEMVK